MYDLITAPLRLETESVFLSLSLFHPQQIFQFYPGLALEGFVISTDLHSQELVYSMWRLTAHVPAV